MALDYPTLEKVPKEKGTKLSNKVESTQGFNAAKKLSTSKKRRSSKLLKDVWVRKRPRQQSVESGNQRRNLKTIWLGVKEYRCRQADI